MRYPAAFLIALILVTPGVARADAIDDYIAMQLRKLHIPGLSIAIVQDGRIVKAAGYGFADLQHKVPASPASVYEIGSNTKQFTAAAVMLLVQDGTLSLGDPVEKFLPEAPASWKPITVRHLLTHTSGIQNHVGVPGFLDTFRTNLSLDTTPARDELLKRFFQLPLEFEPGESWAYDNTGFYMLGVIVEKASGMAYFQFLNERIFKPLGMSATRSSDPRPLVPNRAAGYEWVKGEFQNRPTLLPAIAFSAGTIISTVEDLAKWDAALYGDTLLTGASRDAMWTAAKTNDGAAAPINYGFGWFLGSYRGRRIVQHSGGTPGFSSAFYRFMDDRLSVIILTNHADRVIDHMAIDIAGLYRPALKRPEGSPDPEPATTRQMHKVFADLREGRIEDAVFTAPMRTFLHTTTGKGMWQWFAGHGPVTSFTFSESEPESAGRVRRYRVVLGDDAYWFSFDVTGGRIAQIYWW